MDAKKIMAFESVLDMASDISSQHMMVDDLHIRLKGFEPDELLFLSKRYNGHFQVPTAALNRYCTRLEVGCVQVEALSGEYRINYSYSPLNSRVRASRKRPSASRRAVQGTPS